MKNITIIKTISFAIALGACGYLAWGLGVSHLGLSDKKRADADRIKGAQYHNQGEYDKAISSYSKSAQLNPNVTLTFYLRGLSYFENKDYDNAIRDFTQAYQLSPTNTDALIHRGIAYIMKGKEAEAEKDFSKAIEIHATAEGYNERGLIYVKKGEYDKAISDFSKSIEINSNFAFPYQWRAVAYCYKKQFDRAWEDEHKAENLANYKPNEEFIAELKKESGRNK